jgi:hypothetical protein
MVAAAYEKEFFFRGYPSGSFVNEWVANVPMTLAYKPYKGPGHSDMQEELKKSGVAQCYCDSDQGRHFFDVRKGSESRTLDIDNFSLSKLPEKNIMSWLDPWVPVGLGAEKELVRELEKEVGANHILFERKCLPLARRIDRDEYLFQVQDSVGLHAVVHLTWSGKTESDDPFPKTVLFQSIEEWMEKMKRDHDEYMA